MYYEEKIFALVIITITLMSSVVFAGTVNDGKDMLFQRVKIYGDKYSLLATGRVCNYPYN